MRLLSSPQRMHAAVESGFPPDHRQESQLGRTLWRIDRLSDRIALLIASPTEPDLSALVEQAGWQTGEMWQTRPYHPFINSLAGEQYWSFRLTANPVYGGRKEGWHDTKPRGHVTVKQQEQWLLDRAEKLGFEIPDGPADAAALKVTDRRTARFGRKGGPDVTIAVASYEGILRITDVERMRSTLTNGVGRAKAYGCGLLTLAPLRSE